MMSKHGLAVLCAGTSLFAGPMAAWAQPSAPAGGAPPVTLRPEAPKTEPNQTLAAPPSNVASEVIVTARRRDENIEKVPIAITAISAAQLRDRSIFSESDLQISTPGLTVRQNGSANQFNYSIRGQTVDTYSSSPPGVLSYVDEAQIVSHSSTTFYDLQGVQVLKGPQGTLFGRNSTGGAVLFQTAQPGQDFGGYVDARYGSFDYGHVEGAVSLPVNDAIALRVAASYTTGDDYVHDIASNTNFGGEDIKSIRTTAVIRPNSRLTNTTVLQYTHENGTNTPTELLSVYGCGQTYHGVALTSTIGCFYSPGTPAFDAYRAAHPTLFQGGAVAYVGYQKSLGEWNVDQNYPDFHKAESKFAINTTTYQISPSLTLKNIFSFNDSRSDDGYDYDGTPYTIYQTGGVANADGTGYSNTQGFGQETKQGSEELQLQGKAFANRLVYVLGGYYLDEKDETDSPIYAYDFSPIAPGVSVTYHSQNEDKSGAVFFQGTYKVIDRLNFTGGFRYTWDTVSEVQLPGSLFEGAAREETSASKPSYTVSLDYQVLPSLLAYVTSRGSWRAGGYNYGIAPLNATATQGGNAFLPETAKDVEVGAKYSGREFGVPVTLNADVFNQWVDNVQRAAYVVGVAGTGTLFTANVPSAEITGLEVDGSIRPLPWLLVGGSLVDEDPRYTNASVTVLGTPTTYGPYADTPRFTGTLFGEVSHTLPETYGQLALRADLYNETLLHLSNVGETIAPDSTIPGYTITNMRLTWSQLMGTKAALAFYVRNLANEQYFTGGNADGPASGFNTVTVGQPRMFGGELSTTF